MLLAGVVIPSDGDHGFFHVKSLLFSIASLFWLLSLWERQAFNLFQWKLLTFFFSSVLFLMLWCCVGLFWDETQLESIFGQVKVIAVTFLFVVMTLDYAQEEFFDVSTYLRVVLIGNLFYSLTKVSLVFGHFLGFFDVLDVLDLMGLRYMSMDIMGSMIRMQTSVDLLTPFLFLFVLQAPHLSKWLRFSWFGVSVLACALSFSRLFLFIMVVSFLMTSWRRCLVSCCVLLCLLVFEPVREAISNRYYGVETAYSDEVRTQQIAALKKEFDQYPIFGKGMGG
ncbi:MAG: hypothetical protein KDK65_04600, partial [Chlamydiia bacterium]|nr:hypothetical protein [Chlamydiia bacterium]